MSLMDASYAVALGLDEADARMEEAVTASGDSVVYLHWPEANLEIEFESRRLPYHGGFIEFPPEADPTNLLGRSDFFQQYIIQFWESAQLMNVDLAPQFSYP